MLLLADIAPEPDRTSEAASRAAHANELLAWGIGLSMWFFLTGTAAVAGVAIGLRHAIDPPSPTTKKLGLWTAGANGALAIVSLVMAIVLKGSPAFGGFSIDVAAMGWILSFVQLVLAVANAGLALGREVVVPKDDGQD